MSDTLRILLLGDNPDTRALAIQELQREFSRLEVVQVIEGGGLSEAVLRIGQLLAGLAHELNTPLSAILGHATILQQILADNPHVGRVEKIAQAADRCSEIVNNFLTLSRRQLAPQFHTEGRGKRILVVDDELGIATVLVEVLQLDGHAVEMVGSGEAALRKLGAEEYDLILSDIRMPDLDGPTLYREIEVRHPCLLRRFIFLTGDIISPEISHFLEHTGVPYLRKPFTLEMVREVVQRALAEQHKPA
ncbi:MAG: response regulator [Candidatus Tectomicrobia bacterium]|jgi:CheY-like chemotaxis protein|nr:response regulator [Candidatus Tectomicrobia bacterium]